MADAPEVQADGGAVETDADQNAAKTVDMSSPDIQAAIQQAAEAATKDFKNKLNEFRENNISLSRQLEQWKSLGMDQEKLKEIVHNISKNKETQLAAEGKFEDLLALRTEPMRKDYETKLSEATSRIDDLTERLKAAATENFDLRVSGQVANACTRNSDLQPDAHEIVIRMARDVWHIEENNEAIPRRPNGARWISKDGKTDISYDEWIDGPVKDKYPSLFKAPTGPSVRGGPGKVSMDYLNQLPPLQRLEEARRMGMTK